MSSNAVQYALELLNALAVPAKASKVSQAYTNGVAVLTQVLQQNRNPTVAEWTALRTALTTANPPINPPHAVAAPPVSKAPVGRATLVQPAPAGIDYIDSNGAVMFTAGLTLENPPLYGTRRYDSMAFLPYVEPGSNAAILIQNNSNMDDARATQVDGLTGAAARDQNDAVIPNTFSMQSKFNTQVLCVAEVNRLIASNTNPQGGGDFSPFQKKG